MTVLALSFVVSACSSVKSEDTGSSPVGAAADDIAGSPDQDASPSAGMVSCGPVSLDSHELVAASGRLPDTAVEVFGDAGVSLGAPERWSAVLLDDDQAVIVDPVPLDTEGSSYWVRIARADAGLVFDGICELGDRRSADAPVPVGPSQCSIVEDGFAVTTIWSDVQPALSVAVVRDGVEIHVAGPTSFEAGGSDILDARRVEHGELAPGDGGPATTSGSESRDPALEDLGGAHADLTAEPGTAHSYAVQTIAGDGRRSDLLPCGEGQRAEEPIEISCNVTSDEFGWPVIRWEAAVALRVLVVRDGLPLQSAGGNFSSPHVDRSAPVGQVLAYGIELPDGQAISCGSAEVASEPEGSRQLQQAATDTVAKYPGPFQYVTLEPICTTCEGQVVELYLVPDPTEIARHEVEKVWIDGIEVSSSGVWALDPLFVAHELLSAEEAGNPIEWSIDGQTGLVREWSIAGEGARLVCIEIDTRPIELRDERCGRSNLLS